jgi:hypothetical protein
MKDTKKQTTCCENDKCENRFECPNYYATKYRIRYLKNVAHLAINLLFLALFFLMFFLGRYYGR